MPELAGGRRRVLHRLGGQKRRGIHGWGRGLPQYRLDHYRDVIRAVKRSGANWVRLVFRSNPQDFLYANQSSFNEYDAVVKELRGQGLHIMGTVLDTGQWPRTMTPSIYAQRAQNLALHYKDAIRSWDVGSELNGDWLGGDERPAEP